MADRNTELFGDDLFFLGYDDRNSTTLSGTSVYMSSTGFHTKLHFFGSLSHCTYKNIPSGAAPTSVIVPGFCAVREVQHVLRDLGTDQGVVVLGESGAVDVLSLAACKRGDTIDERFVGSGNPAWAEPLETQLMTAVR